MGFDLRDYVEEKLDRAKPSAKHEWTAACPRCSKWGGFYINTETGAFVCFKCDYKSRNIIPLVAELEGLTWSEAAKWLFRRSVTLRRKADIFTLRDRILALRPHDALDSEEPPVDFELPDGFRPCWSEERGAWSLPVYLKERRLLSRTAKAWGLGWVRRAEVPRADRDRPMLLRERLVIPIQCPAGRSWTARDMTGEQIPKYLNPPGADHRRLLIGWNMARMTGDLVICEGPLDAIKLWQHDVSAVALGGKEIHSDQLAMLVSLPSSTAIVVMLDPEERAAPLKVAARLSCHFENIYIAKLPDGVDPGSSTRAQAHSAVEGAARYRGDRAASLAAKLAASRAALASRYATKPPSSKKSSME